MQKLLLEYVTYLPICLQLNDYLSKYIAFLNLVKFGH